MKSNILKCVKKTSKKKINFILFFIILLNYSFSFSFENKCISLFFDNNNNTIDASLLTYLKEVNKNQFLRGWKKTNAPNKKNDSLAYFYTKGSQYSSGVSYNLNLFSESHQLPHARVNFKFDYSKRDKTNLMKDLQLLFNLLSSKLSDHILQIEITQDTQGNVVVNGYAIIPDLSKFNVVNHIEEYLNPENPIYKIKNTIVPTVQNQNDFLKYMTLFSSRFKLNNFILTPFDFLNIYPSLFVK